MRSLEEIQREYDRAHGEISALMDTRTWINTAISKVFTRIDGLNQEIDAHPGADQEVHSTRRDPEEKVWSAMQGGTDGG